MAHSFEKRVLQFEPIKELLLLFDPSSKPVYRGKVDTDLGFEVHRYILPSGEDELVRHPEYFFSDSIEIPITVESGDTVIYNLKLPFNFLDAFTSIPRMAKEKVNNPEKANAEITEYLQTLSNDPSINPDLNEFLETINGKFIFKGFNLVEENSNLQIELLKPPDQIFEIDLELLFKLFLKIVWTHSAKHFGIMWTSNSLSRWIFNYLTSGHIDDIKLITCYPGFFTDPIRIDQDEYSFWKFSIEKSYSMIQAVENSKEKNKLFRYHQKRQEQFDIANQLISYSSANGIDDNFRSQKENMRFHNLTLLNMSFLEYSATVCSISLFGGFFDAQVQISEKPILFEDPLNLQIKF